VRKIERPRILRLDVPIEGKADREALRGALLAARASELSELQRRARATRSATAATPPAKR